IDHAGHMFTDLLETSIHADQLLFSQFAIGNVVGYSINLIAEERGAPAKPSRAAVLADIAIFEITYVTGSDHQLGDIERSLTVIFVNEFHIRATFQFFQRIAETL